MTVEFQASLFDALEAAVARPAAGRAAGATVPRHVLTRGAWVDVRPGWVSGSDALFERLVREVPWQAERRHDVGQRRRRAAAAAVLRRGRAAARPAARRGPRTRSTEHYRAELGEPFRTAGMCFYRDGRDSVAWHGDTIGRSSTEDTMVAILSLGEARRLSAAPARRRRLARRSRSGTATCW